MPPKKYKFHHLSDRSKRRRINIVDDDSSSNSTSSISLSNADSPNKYVIEDVSKYSSSQFVSDKTPLCSSFSPKLVDDQQSDSDLLDSSSSITSMVDESDQYFDYKFKSLLQNEDDSSFDIKTFLRCWAVKHNITDTSLSDLLVGLKNNVEALSNILPSDARTLLKTNVVFEKKIVDPGSYLHFGLEKQLKNLVSNIALSNVQDLKLLINVDGLPLFKSSAGQVHPILVSVINVPELNKIVFPVGIYYGLQKPNSMFDFLNPLINELVDLNNKGLTSTLGTSLPIKFIGLCCDAPAKKDVLGIKNFGGYFSCTKCKVCGETVDGKRVFTDLDCEPRTHDEFINRMDINYRTNDTPLVRIPGIDFVKSIILDYMHLVCLGVMRTMLLIWLDGRIPHKLSRQLKKIISDFMIDNRTRLPAEFVRQPRDFKYILRFKAVEYRSFLIYLGPVALRGVLSNDKYDNFLTLHVAMTILLNPKSCQNKDLRNYSKSLLRIFIQNFMAIYGDSFITHNFHGLIHLGDDADYFSPMLDNFTLHSISAFPFENYLQTIKNMVRGMNKPLEQIGKRLAQLFSIQCSFPSNYFTSKDFPKLLNIHSNGPLTSSCSNPQYTTLLFTDFKIKISPPNNCCGTRNGDIIMVENICYSKEFNSPVIVGRKFKQKSDFYVKPCKSSLIGVFEVKNKSFLKSWPVADIITKYVILPYKQNYVTFPLLHTV